ncbi:restriction endonuclease [Undibacterium sp. TS12]|uniref:restriction endonuclease n=1 Tax=Undibacterium sp. TS12 TaxID=2908202 RepID=UPI001F4C8DB3|nr:restriction endonuclease [Undibacterium sp. TS12]MCH8622829.1 restriction endonuclease [Undibacterium sp. TS12]
MPTKFDELYQKLFNSTCTKEGAAFERLAAAITSIVFPDADVAHDQKLRGQFSKSLYQIDVLRQESGEKIFGEAKDYTERGEAGGKVGRPDLQKLGGALPDIGAQRGVFYSATDYTREAKKYADAAKDIVGVPIDLLHIRPSVESDKDGRIQKIVINFACHFPNYENAKWTPIFTEGGRAVLQKLADETESGSLICHLRVKDFLDHSGKLKNSIQELTAGGFGNDFDSDLAHGCFLLPSHYIEIHGKLVEIFGIEYSVPFIMETKIIEIVTEGEPQILVKAENGTIDKLITDKQLQKIKFDDIGNVVRLK